MCEKITPQLITQYERVTRPKNMMKQFSSRTKFIEWAKEGTKKDLKHTISAFVEDELYEHTHILINVLKNKK